MPVEVTFSFTGYAALAGVCGFAAVYRRYIRNGRRPSWDIDLNQSDIQPVEEEFELEPKLLHDTVRSEIRDILEEHCPSEQKRLREIIVETIRRTVAEASGKDGEWRGRVSQRLENGNSNFETLSKRIDRLDTEFDVKIESLRKLIIDRTPG